MADLTNCHSVNHRLRNVSELLKFTVEMNNKMKKIDLDRKLKLVKDSGDVRKIEKSVAGGSGPVTKNKLIIKNCDRGDSIAKFAAEKVRCTERRLVEVLPRNVDRQPSRDHEGKTKNLNEMRRIKENYTIRSKYYMKKCEMDKVESEIKHERASKPKEEAKATPPSDHMSSVKSPSSSAKTDLKRKMPSKTATLSQQIIRRPIIKTITSRDDKSKVYKAVNFVERKVQQTHLQINMPMIQRKAKESKPLATKVSMKEKRRKETDSYTNPPLSPDVTVRIKSPPTEMAKWANVDHTKVYYEAWVNTTLAAISKKVKEKNFDKQNLIKTFKKALAERPVSPDLDYKELLDEKYTGKIKVNKR